MKKYLILILTTVLLFVNPGCSQKSESGKTRNIILDVDTSVDDLMAILYLLACPDINIKAITIVNGVSNVDSGAEIVLRLLNLTGRHDIPVAKGATQPLSGNNSFPDKWQPQVHNPFGLELPSHSLKSSELNATDIISQLLNSYKHDINILAFGPLTNIAKVFLDQPDLAEHINNIYMSDGAVYVEGAINMEYPEINNTVSGWNLWVDPKAADIVYNSGADIVLVPLDLTALHSPDPLALTTHLVEKFNTCIEGPVGQSLGALMNNWISFYHSDTKIESSVKSAPVWDAVAAIIFHKPDVCTEWYDCHIRIKEGHPDTAGQIIVVEGKEPNASVCLKGNQAIFDSLFLRAGGKEF